MVCPYCNNPVKQNEKAQRWLLLIIPFFVANFIEIFASPNSYVPHWAMWMLAILGILGGILVRATSRFEKIDGI